MASTRNKNTSVNFKLEQLQNSLAKDYTTYKHSAYGEAVNTNLPGNGLNPGQLPGNTLSYNAADIESFLFGINSTNLVNPAPTFTPELKNLNTVNIFESTPTYLPNPLIIHEKQRPQFS
jgi:hypothetical protein